MPDPDGSATFGALLRELRLAAGLTQEALAERAGLSPRAIQQLEADSARPRRFTARRLATALALSAEGRARFEAAAGPAPRGRRSGGSDAISSPAESPPARASSPEGERKPVTVLFAGLPARLS